jgi:hypothetical protein
MFFLGSSALALCELARARGHPASPQTDRRPLRPGHAQAYHILDELLITGELQEPSKKAILRVTAAQDALMEGSGDSKVSDSKYEI